MKEAFITVYTKQVYTSHEDTHSEVFKGKVAKKGDNLYIIYTEENKDQTITTNQIKVDKESRVYIKRMGSTRSNLCFDKNKSHKTFYQTLYGTMELIFVSRVVEYQFVSAEHRIRLEYDIYMGEDKLSRNTYCIQVNTFI